MRTAGIILSGGKGTRFGGAIPKQYLEICEKPVLAYTLEAFQKSRVDQIVIVAAEEYQDLCRKIADHFHCSKVSAVITGGRERYDSVWNGLKYLQQLPRQEKQGVSEEEPRNGFADSGRCHRDDEELVLIHDGARPFIQPEIIDQVIDAVISHGAAIAATPCTDTIKLVDEDQCIVSTTERKCTWAAQTPQGFRLSEISEAYEKVFGGTNCSGNVPMQPFITDDAMVYQMAFPDRKVRTVDAGSGNFKITTVQDLQRGESYYSRLSDACAAHHIK